MTSLLPAVSTRFGSLCRIAACRASVPGRIVSSPGNSLMNVPRARRVTSFQLRGAPPPDAVRLRRTRGWSAYAFSFSQVPSSEEWSAMINS